MEGGDNLWLSNLDTPSRLPAAFTSLCTNSQPGIFAR